MKVNKYDFKRQLITEIALSHLSVNFKKIYTNFTENPIIIEYLI